MIPKLVSDLYQLLGACIQTSIRNVFHFQKQKQYFFYNFSYHKNHSK